MAQQDAVVAVWMAEYNKLKEEQVHRLGMRDNLIYAALAAAAAVVYAAWQLHLPAALLAVPVPVLALGWVYLRNDEKIVQIRTYIRDDLEPRLQAALGTDLVLFGWERGDPRKGLKVDQLAVNLAIFVVPAAAALVALAALTPGPLDRLTITALVTGWLVAAVATAAMLIHVVRNSLYRKQNRR